MKWAVVLMVLASACAEHAPRQAMPPASAATVAAAAKPFPPVVARHCTVDKGERVVARMNETIGTARALGPDRLAELTRPGQPYTATIETPIVDIDGSVLVPPGALVHGHIASLTPGTGLSAARLELTADAVQLGAGDQPLAARVVDTELQQVPTFDAGKTVDSAAFGGAIIGGVAFGIPGVFIGYSFGGTGGAGTVVDERHVHGWLSAGGLITVELEEPLRVKQRACALHAVLL
jgi:hypothetical protein